MSGDSPENPGHPLAPLAHETANRMKRRALLLATLATGAAALWRRIAMPNKYLCVWVGPIMAKTMEGPAEGWDLLTINKGIGGVGSSAFDKLGIAKGGPHALQTICAERGLDWESYEHVAIIGFSAAHGLLKHIFRSPAVLNKCAYIGIHDAYYTNASKAVKPGFRAAFERAARGDFPCMVTSSPIGGPAYPSSTDALAPAMAGLGLRDTGRLPVGLPPDWQPPARVMHRGKLWWASWGPWGTPKQRHVWQATRLAPLFARHFLQSALHKGAVKKSGMGDLVFIGGAALLAKTILEGRNE